MSGLTGKPPPVRTTLLSGETRKGTKQHLVGALDKTGRRDDTWNKYFLVAELPTALASARDNLEKDALQDHSTAVFLAKHIRLQWC